MCRTISGQAGSCLRLVDYLLTSTEWVDQGVGPDRLLIMIGQIQTSIGR